MAPAAIAKLAMNNALAAGWVHEVVHANARGKSLSMVNDIGTSDGRQVVDANGAKATVIVLGSAAYIQGDANAITNYFGLSSVDPQRVAGKWLSLDANDPNYSAVTASVTLDSDFSNLVVGPFTRGSVTTVAGRQAIHSSDTHRRRLVALRFRRPCMSRQPERCCRSGISLLTKVRRRP